MPYLSDRSHAIVIGGGIAGLLAARVLTDHFEQVTLIERDHYPQTPLFRPGVPQGRQVHTMLLRGQQALERFFPGLEAKLLARGAVERYYGNESLYCYGGGRCPQIPPVLRGWNCSRLLVEWQICQELRNSPHLHVMEGYEVTNLLFEEKTRKVSGVQMRRHGDRDKAMQREDLSGDLVVDASGSTSSVSQWLENAGYERPKETIVNPDLGYATCFYAIPTTPSPAWKGIAIQGTGQHRAGGVLMEIEGERWMVVLSGGAGKYPPTQPEEFLTFAQGLSDPSLYEAIKDAERLSPIYGYRRTENRLRHFERLAHQPEGFIVLGDAVCSFNPVYGQGMTVAVLEAQLLDRCLRSSKRSNFAQTFQRKVTKLVAFPWRLATSADRRPEEGQKQSFSQSYMELVVALLTRDPAVLLAFLQVIHMLRSPIILFSPPLVTKVILFFVEIIFRISTLPFRSASLFKM